MENNSAPRLYSLDANFYSHGVTVIFRIQYDDCLDAHETLTMGAP